MLIGAITIGFQSCGSDDDSCEQQDVTDGPGICDTNLTLIGEVSITVSNGNRVITTNSVPSHQVGTFMN